MNKLYYVLAGLCLCAVWSTAETIDSVSFNPARLGRYETLKVSNELNALGGVETQAVTVQSGGAVRVNNAGSYRFAETEVEGGVEMKNTEFVANALQSHGTASFESALGKESRVEKLTHNGDVDVRANILDMKKVEVMAPGTSGSWRLGENLIASPESVGLSNCKDLDWYKRVDDRNYEWQVLAFGSCDAPAKDCEPFQGSWAYTSETSPKDTCDGDAEKSFRCPVPYDGEPFSCVDYAVQTVYVGDGGVQYGREQVIGSGDYYSAEGKDTCDGNIFTRYTGQKNCTDVFWAGESSVLSQELCNMADLQFMQNTHLCIETVYAYDPNKISTIKGWADYLDTHTVEDFCANVIFPQMGDHVDRMTSSFGCSVSMDFGQKDDEERCRFPRVRNGSLSLGNDVYVYEGVICKGMFKYREITFQGYDRVMQRNIHCCPNEITMGTVTGTVDENLNIRPSK